MKYSNRLTDEEYKKIDFKKIYSKANEVIALSRSVNTFPFKVKKLVYEFSVIHEFGHYILGHKMNLSEDDPLYHRQEVGAN